MQCDAAMEALQCDDDMESVSSPSFSPSDEEYELSYSAAREQFSDYCHDPPPPTATAKRPCLKSPTERNKEWDAWHSNDGKPITPESCQDLVESMIYSGCWRLVMGESYRTLTEGPARSSVMEFVVATRPEHEAEMPQYAKEIKLAGFDHWSLCGTNGWEPFELPREAKGWGRLVTDYERLADWHAERAFSIPMPHHGGDGWVCRAKHYPKAAYPDANEHGPHGTSGPRWTSVA